MLVINRVRLLECYLRPIKLLVTRLTDERCLFPALRMLFAALMSGAYFNELKFTCLRSML